MNIIAICCGLTFHPFETGIKMLALSCCQQWQ